MMFMVKTKQKAMKNKKPQIKQNILMLAVVTVLGLSIVAVPLVQADQFDEQIKQIQADNQAKQQTVSQLQVEAESYQGEIDRLQGQIDTVRGQIRENEAKRDELQAKITVAEAELAKQKVLLGENIKAVYVEGNISTLEMLASSKDLSQFLDKQQYRDTVQQKIRDTLDKINALKAQLKDQKTQVEKLLADQQVMNQQLGEAQTKQSGLLAYTQDQKNQYTAQIHANNTQISALKAQQAAAYAAYARKSGVVSYGIGDANNGGYPSELANAPQDSLVDNWGMYNRECVSYVAWKAASTGAYVPYGLGNAADWARNASAHDIPVGSDARSGSVAVWEENDGLGTLGHVAYVELVNGDGSIEVSQYNFIHGRYSRMHVPASDVARLSFIYF